MTDEQRSGWRFTDEEGAFLLPNPHHTSHLYFPLVNAARMMSAITPTLNGDVKAGQNAFLTLPVSVEDLHNSRSARNFWVTVAGAQPWSATGASAPQTARRFDEAAAEQVTLEAGFLWHKIIRENRPLGLRAEIVNFAPAGGDQVELMQVTLTNVADRPLTFTATAAIPIYGRSADNVRDHRHVTSLLHRIRCHPYGVLVRPTLSFDERGHQPNTVSYAVLGATAGGARPAGFFPVVEQFIGEGGTLDWPEAVVRPLPASHAAGDTAAGYEALGGLRFPEITLAPGASHAYVLILAILDGAAAADALVAAYGAGAQFQAWLERTQQFWRAKLGALSFQTGDPRFDGWLRWVALQPTLRRLFGNSFLPYHDYGRGGRGWRDLWQDILALLIMETDDVGDRLLGHFAGVRIDGSNATIIGAAPGEFQADRNNIPRMWMDHGAWPLLTTQLYIDQTGDLGFLLRQQTYFRDHLLDHCQRIDPAWRPEGDTRLRTSAGSPYRGSVLEHLLVQHLTQFFNVGEHNNIRLQGADWNDGLDMAPQRGESVAFTALYASNLRQLSALALALPRLGVKHAALAEELLLLLDTLAEPVDYAAAAAKQQRLAAYFERCRGGVAGRQVAVPLADLAGDLAAKAAWLYGHLREREWMRNAAGYGWFNGYYDDDGQRVEGDHPNGVRMTLTGQVFALMGGIASDRQAREIVRSVDRYLRDPAVGGVRLNTDFGAALPNLGRCFGFAFGHKENGAMFSHMAVMYANALYRRGLAAEGWRVLKDIYRHCQDFAVSRMYPGLPEYVNPRGRGLYPYLTGSASWWLLTLVAEVYGVRGVLGDLALAPKLLPEQFDEAGETAITTLFAGRRLQIVYHNPARLDYGQYRLGDVRLAGRPAAVRREEGLAILPRPAITALEEGLTHRIDATLVTEGA